MNMQAQHRKKDPVRLHKQLLESAATIAGRDGISSQSLNAVAREAGVSKGGLLHHFPNRQALIFALFARLLEIMEEAISELMAALPVPIYAICRRRNSRIPRRAAS
jgi:transcriptional regulator, TetR family